MSRLQLKHKLQPTGWNYELSWNSSRRFFAQLRTAIRHEPKVYEAWSISRENANKDRKLMMSLLIKNSDVITMWYSIPIAKVANHNIVIYVKSTCYSGFTIKINLNIYRYNRSKKRRRAYRNTGLSHYKEHTVYNLIHIVGMVGPCTSFVACLIITGIIACVNTVIGSSVHMKARLSIYTTPTFAIELNSKVNVAFIGCGFCTTTNKPGGI